MSQTLYYTNNNHPNFQQIIIAAQLVNHPLVTQKINNKYLPLNLVTSQGVLNQPISIMIYLLGNRLIGQTQQQQSQLYQWFQFLNMQFHPLLSEIVGQVNQQKPANKQRYDYSIRQITRVFEIFNNHLKLRTVFIGNSITAVDISLATHLDKLFKEVLTEQSRKKLNNLSRWFSFVRSSPPFINVLGQISFCQKDKEFRVAEPNKNEQAKTNQQSADKKA